jgi:hypothetical protein
MGARLEGMPDKLPYQLLTRLHYHFWVDSAIFAWPGGAPFRIFSVRKRARPDHSTPTRQRRVTGLAL